jgi:hypothetical protein
MGIYILPRNNNFLSLSGGTVSGETFFNNSLSAVTYFSGSTPLEQIIYYISSLNSGRTYSFSAGSNILLLTSSTNPNVIYSLDDDILLNSISASTLYSGTTNLSDLFLFKSDKTFLQNGINTFTGGTVTNPSVNITALTINTLIASGNSTFTGTLSGGSSFSANTLFSGTSNLDTLFVTPGQLINAQTFVQPGVNTYTGGTPTRPTVNVSALTINTLNVSGNSIFTGTLSGGSSFSANTLFSGTTNLYDIFSTTGSISSSNVWTAGTGSNSIKQANALSVASGTYSLSFGKNSYAQATYSIALSHSSNIFNTSRHSIILGGVYLSTNQYTSYNTLVGGKSNSTTFSTYNFIGGGISNLIDGYAKNYYSIRSVIVGGFSNKIYRSIDSGIFAGNKNTIGIKSVTARSGNTIVGGINNTVISQRSSILAGYSNRITSYNSVILGGYSNNIKSVYGNIKTKSNSILGGEKNFISYSNRSIIIGGFRNSALTVSDSCIIGGSYLTVTQNNTVVVPKLRIASITSSPGNYMLVSNTNGYTFKTLMPVLSINNGINTYTGGTPTNPTINVSALTINTLIASGNSIFTGTLSGGSSFSANTIFSGTSNLNILFSHTGHTHNISDINNLQNVLNTKLNISGGTMTGGLLAPSISATTLSGGTIYSGSTDLSDLFYKETLWLPGNTGTNSVRSLGNNKIYNNNSFSVGYDNKIYSYGSSIINGSNNRIYNIYFYGHNSIAGGISNKLYTADQGFIFGNNNRIGSGVLLKAGGNLSILQGLNNQIYSSSYRSTILNGNQNKIHRSLGSVILNGKQNYINSAASFTNNYPSYYSSILQGLNNFLYRTKYSDIINGRNNKIEKSNYSIVLNGRYNYIQNNSVSNVNYNLIGSGFRNIISGSSASTIISSFNSKISNSNNVVILGLENFTAETSYSAVYVPALSISYFSGNSDFMLTVDGSTGFVNKTSIPSAGQSTIIRNGLNTYTAGTTADYTVNISALTINTLFASGNSIFTGTLSGGSSFSANTIYSGSTDLNNLFLQKNGILLQKNGIASGFTFAGSPLICNVIFSNPFSNNNYVITVTGEDARMWSIQSKTVNGFTINSNSSVAITGNVFWMASENGEGYK